MKKTYALCAMLALFNGGKSIAQTLNAPVLEMPLNGTANAAVKPLLHWKRVNGASNYQLKIFKKDSTLVLDVLLKDTVISVPDLAGNTMYTWTLRAMSATDSSAYSAKFYFTTATLALPSMPIPKSPSFTVGEESTGLTFTWTASTLASKYHLQISSDSLFITKQINDSTLTRTSFQTPSQFFSKNVKYFWRIAGINATGKSTFSGRVNFTISAPAAPIVITKKDTVFTANPVLSWSKVTGATSYCVQVAKDIDFTQLITNSCNITATSYTVKSDTLVSARMETASQKYYWRIAAVNATGQSAWTATNTYTASIVTAIEASYFAPTVISVFPNPVTDVLTINSEVESVNVTNTSCELVFEGSANTINMENLSDGLYFVELRTKAGYNQMVKVIKGR